MVKKTKQNRGRPRAEVMVRILTISRHAAKVKKGTKETERDGDEESKG